jgi:cell division protein FtsI (penicillin-binding protein 3)
VIDDPKGFKIYGSDVAAPVFKEVADKVYARDLDLHSPVPEKAEPQEKGVFPVIRAGNSDDLRIVCNAMGISNHADPGDDEWVSAGVLDNSISWTQRKMPEGAVPDVSGMTLRDAIYILENKGLRVRYSGNGRVSEQSIPAGSKVEKGRLITLNLS